jgi:hypothetical protein
MAESSFFKCEMMISYSFVVQLARLNVREQGAAFPHVPTRFC